MKQKFRLVSSRRAQITLFLIIAVILLFSSALIFYIHARTGDISPSLEPIKKEIPAEYKPISQFIDNCIYLTAEEAVTRMALHGGYINTTNYFFSQKNFDIREANPTSSDGVLFFPNSRDSFIPYWLYLKTDIGCTNCLMDTNIPSIELMQEQINKYLILHLESCFGSFEEFTLQGFEIDSNSPLEVTSQINKQDISVLVTKPVIIRKSGREFVLDKFYSSLQVRYQTAYELAKELATYELDSQHLENMISDIISYHSGLDERRLPPYSDMSEGYDTIYWSKYGVKNALSQLIASYVSNIQVSGSANHRLSNLPGENVFEETFYESLVQTPNLSQDYSSFHVNFIEQEFPIYFQITPSSGDILKPSSFRTNPPVPLIPVIQTNHYKFFYDVSVPFVIEITDPEAFKGKGLSFFFAMEANIRDNKNMLDWHLGNGTFGAPLGEVTFDGLNALDDEGNQNAPRRNITNVLMCNDNQKLSGNYTLRAKDKLTGVALSDVTVNFVCGDYASCPSGILRYSASGFSDEPLFVTQFPLCLGAHLSFEKDGYQKGIHFLSTRKDLGGDITVELMPLIEFNVSIKKMVLFWNFTGTYPPRKFVSAIMTPVSLSEQEKLFLTIEKKTAEPFEEFTSQTVIHDAAIDDLNEQDNYFGKIKLSPGNYEISGQLLDSQGAIIPARCTRVCSDYYWWGSCKEHTYIPSEPINLSPAPFGGIQLDNNTRQWTVNAQQIVNAQEQGKELRITIIKTPAPSCIGDLEEMQKIDFYSMRYYDIIRPEFV